MLHSIISKIDQKLHFDTASAHCDIPCGIYDPHLAQLSALTVIRMLDLMADLEKGHTVVDTAFRNSMIRYVAVKEEHAVAECRIYNGVPFFQVCHQVKHTDNRQG